MPGLFDDLVSAPAPASTPAGPPSMTSAPAPRGLFDDLVAAPKPGAELAGPVESDPIRAQVRKEIDDGKAKGQDTSAGYGRRFLQGITGGGADDVIAAATAIPEMFKRGVGYGDAFKYALAREHMDIEDGAAKQGLLGTAVETVGGIGAGVGLMKAGVTALSRAQALFGKGLVGTSAGLAADGAAIGAVTGALGGSDMQDRVDHAKTGAVVGGGIGLVGPAAVAALGKVISPLVSNVRARMDPAGYAERQVGRAAADAGLAPAAVEQRLLDAAADGQTEYRLVDALGYPGQRAGAVVAKNPGEGRAAFREFLEDRQADQGRRLATTLAEGFDAPQTAAQAQTGIKAARDTAADAAYGQARADAGAVDITGAVRRIDETLKPGISGLADPQSGLANDSVEAVLARARSLLSDGKSQVSGFEAVQRIKADLDDMVSSAVRSGQNNRARLLGQVARELDTALEGSSASYAGARNAFRQGSREMEAVDTGRTAASRGRTEDTIPAFQALSPGEQAAFRTGYVDPLIERVQGAVDGSNKARQFSTPAFRAEADAIAPAASGPQMQRRIAREGDMYATRNQASGGSSTAENLADFDAAGVDVGAIAKLLTGDVFGAGRDALRSAGANLSGNTEAVRAQMADILTRGNPAEVRALLERVAQAAQANAQTGQFIGRGVESAASPVIDGLIGSRPARNRTQAR